MKSFVLLISVVLFFPLFSESKKTEFTILMFNDVYDIHPKSSGLGGFANMTTMLKEERKKSKHHITTLNGDFLFPSMLSTFDKGKHRVELFNEMGIELTVLGNHEFDFGPQVVKDRMSESKFLWFGANVYDLTGNYFTGQTQTYIREVDGIKIGFFGIVTTDTPLLSSCQNQVLFTPLILTAQRMCQQLKEEGAQLIVALTHLFFKEDLMLAREVPDIDIILGGHDHDPVTWYEKDTLIFKAGQNAYFLGRIDLEIEVEEESENLSTKYFPSWKVIANRGIKADKRVNDLVQGYDKVFADIGLKPLCELRATLDSRHSIVRKEESTMANLITDALRDSLNADCAFMSGGIIRGDKLYQKGESLTYKDLMREIAFDNDNILIEVKGRDLLQAIETGLSQWEYFAGKFPQVSGMKIVFNEHNLPGQRVVKVTIGDKPLDLAKYYKLATNTYNAAGGDGFYSLCNGTTLIPSTEAGKLINAVKRYIIEKKYIELRPEGRIQSISKLNFKSYPRT